MIGIESLVPERIRVRGYRKSVFNSGVLWVELAGKIGLRDHTIMRRKMVALITKGTDPDLGSEVDARERVEHGRAGFASERGIREPWDIRVRTDQADGSSKWDHALASFNLGTRPHVPCHSDSIDSFRICVRHFRHRVLNQDEDDKGIELREISGLRCCKYKSDSNFVSFSDKNRGKERVRER